MEFIGYLYFGGGFVWWSLWQAGRKNSLREHGLQGQARITHVNHWTSGFVGFPNRPSVGRIHYVAHYEFVATDGHLYGGRRYYRFEDGVPQIGNQFPVLYMEHNPYNHIPSYRLEDFREEGIGFGCGLAILCAGIFPIVASIIS